MSNNQDITALRATLFAAIEGVKSGALDLDKARSINELGKTIVDTAKVEVDYLRATGGGESSFIDSAVGAANTPQVRGISSVFQHRIQG